MTESTATRKGDGGMANLIGKVGIVTGGGTGIGIDKLKACLGALEKLSAK